MGNNTPAGGEVRGVSWLQQAEDILGITSDLEIIERGIEGEILVDGEWHVAFVTGTGSDVADPTAQWERHLQVRRGRQLLSLLQPRVRRVARPVAG